MSTVTSVKQSPLNDQRWCLTLLCGHEEWVTSKNKPTRKFIKCRQCQLKYHNELFPPDWIEKDGGSGNS